MTDTPKHADLDDIKRRISIDSGISADHITVRIADNEHYIWVTIQKDTTTLSHRLPLEPKPHNIDVLKEAVDQWARDQE